jgi:4-hydroxy-tetrahydrodipicolinate reductase
MIRTAVAGVLGRMGTLAKTAINSADGITFVGGLVRGESLEALIERDRPDVLVDLTTHPDTVAVSMLALERGVSLVIGASGWTPAEREALAKLADERGVGALLVPNFAIGAVLMMRFAQTAARFFPTAQIVEYHHDKKKDAPSGTARITAERIRAGDGPEPAIHSVRLRGLVAHQEVLFGGEGETLAIRHDALSRESFASGIVAAIRAVGSIRGLRVGLDFLLDS